MRHKNDPEALVADVLELHELIPGFARKRRRRSYGDRSDPKIGTYFRKADDLDDEGDAPSAHGQAKAAHHARMAQLYEEIADRHAAMSDHYKGAHPSKDDTADEADQTLNKLAGAGDAAARLRLVPRFDDPSRAGFLATLGRSAP